MATRPPQTPMGWAALASQQRPSPGRVARAVHPLRAWRLSSIDQVATSCLHARTAHGGRMDLLLRERHRGDQRLEWRVRGHAHEGLEHEGVRVHRGLEDEAWDTVGLVCERQDTYT